MSEKIGNIEVDMSVLKEKPVLIPFRDETAFIQNSLNNIDKEIKKAKEYINNLVLTKRMYNRILQKIKEGK